MFFAYYEVSLNGINLVNLSSMYTCMFCNRKYSDLTLKHGTQMEALKKDHER